MESRNFNISVAKKSNINKQLEKMNKRSIRLGLGEIVWTFGKSFVDSKGILSLPIEISGPLFVSYQDWEFVATLQHLPTGENIIRSIIEDADIPLHYREHGSICEHCKVNRYRKDTYLVRNINHKGYVQVGSSCIKDFLGNQSPDNIIVRANFASEIINFINRMGQDSAAEPHYIINNFLAQVSACISVHGWLSKTKAYDNGGKSTVSRVQDYFINNVSDFTVSDFDLKKAEEAIFWVENLSDQEVESSDYLYNIRAIARSGIVEWRTMGFAASIIPAFDKAENSKKVQIISNHVGKIKSRENFNLQLKNKFEYNGTYGMTYKYIFNDEFGNVIVWSASKPHDFLIGGKYVVRGTIKSHSEFKGIKQTEINRCEILCEVDNES